jgi:hypothetical protein
MSTKQSKTTFTVEDFIKRRIPLNVALQLICQEADAPQHLTTQQGVKIPLVDYNLMIINVSASLQKHLFGFCMPKLYSDQTVEGFFDRICDFCQKQNQQLKEASLSERLDYIAGLFNQSTLVNGQNVGKKTTIEVDDDLRNYVFDTIKEAIQQLS